MYWDAWLGGIIDGEGSINIYKQQQKGVFYTPRIVIANTDKRMIAKIVELTGITNISKSSRPERDNWKECWWWGAYKPVDVMHLLERIYPWLVAKQEQALLVHKLCQLLEGRTKKRYTNKDRELAENYYVQVRSLNKRGKTNDERVA